MNYETGSATTPNDLILKLHDFLIASGWTVDEFKQLDNDQPAVGFRLVVNNGTSFVGFRSFIGSDPSNETTFSAYEVSGEKINGIATTSFDNFDPSRRLNLQQNSPTDLAFSQLNSDFCEKYNFFSDVDAGFIALVSEYTLGKFSAIAHGFTTLGREYFTGTGNTRRKNINDKTGLMFDARTYETNFVRNQDGKFINNTSQSNNSTGNPFAGFDRYPTFTSGNTLYKDSFMNMTAHTELEGTFFVHCYQYLEDERRHSGSSISSFDNYLFRFVGTVENFLFCNMRKLEPNQEVSFGSDTYIAFPTYEKPDPFTVDAYQGGQAFLIRKS